MLKMVGSWCLGVSVMYRALFAEPFTVCSYNCGALSDHYDYIRAVCMHDLMQERYAEESAHMHQLEQLQSQALRALFTEKKSQVDRALFEKLTEHPHSEGSVNQKWHALSTEIVSSYKERPIVIYDQAIDERLSEHVDNLVGKALSNETLGEARSVMAKQIFAEQLPYDILALQEADYLDTSLFPKRYETRFSKGAHFTCALAWDKQRFKLLKEVGELAGGHALALLLQDNVSKKTVLVISAHLSGCNPFMVDGKDSQKGDLELAAILERAKQIEADRRVIAMDSNVTAMHPRLRLLKEAGFMVDSQKHLEPTCSNPWHILDTRIDWIAIDRGSISNLAVEGVELNSMEMNISDHKPIAASIRY